MKNGKKAVVLLSGGLDSATLAYYVKSQGYEITALSFSYEQRHKIEMVAAKKISSLVGVREHVWIHTNMTAIGHSSLTDSIPVPKGGKNMEKENHIPLTYVPGRNLIFLSYAIALAESREIHEVFLGINSLDYSGYPDCRPDFLESIQKTSELATKAGREGHPIRIHAPLIKLTKKEIIEMGLQLGVPYEYTWSCYDPKKKGDEYFPCGECDSCLLRRRGFSKAFSPDPLKSMKEE